METSSSIIWVPPLSRPRLDSLPASSFLFLFPLNNVCMVAILIILILFILNIETAVQFLTMKF